MSVRVRDTNKAPYRNALVFSVKFCKITCSITVNCHCCYDNVIRLIMSYQRKPVMSINTTTLLTRMYCFLREFKVPKRLCLLCCIYIEVFLCVNLISIPTPELYPLVLYRIRQNIFCPLHKVYVKVLLLRMHHSSNLWAR